MNSESGFVKQIPVVITDVTSKPMKGKGDPARKTDDLMRSQLGYDTNPKTEGDPYKRLGLDSGVPSAEGAGGMRSETLPHDTGQVPGGV